GRQPDRIITFCIWHSRCIGASNCGSPCDRTDQGGPSMSWKMMRPVMLALGVSSVVLASGCAQEREPINRVQANALDKAFFVGADLVSQEDNPEFLTQATLVDVGYGAAQDGVFTSTYTQGVARIK